MNKEIKENAEKLLNGLISFEDTHRPKLKRLAPPINALSDTVSYISLCIKSLRDLQGSENMTEAQKHINKVYVMFRPTFEAFAGLVKDGRRFKEILNDFAQLDDILLQLMSVIGGSDEPGVVLQGLSSEKSQNLQRYVNELTSVVEGFKQEFTLEIDTSNSRAYVDEYLSLLEKIKSSVSLLGVREIFNKLSETSLRLTAIYGNFGKMGVKFSV
jgi:hypothetical protein